MTSNHVRRTAHQDVLLKIPVGVAYNVPRLKVKFVVDILIAKVTVLMDCIVIDLIHIQQAFAKVNRATHNLFN